MVEVAKKIPNPEELKDLWEDDCQKAWDLLNAKQRKFFLNWINCNFNGSEAYRQTYNKLASNTVAAVCASQALINPNIQILCGKLAQSQKSDLLLIRRVYKDAAEAIKPIFGKDLDGQPEKIEDLPDHKIRIDAAEKLAKLNGELVEKSRIDVNISFAEQVRTAHGK